MRKDVIFRLGLMLIPLGLLMVGYHQLDLKWHRASMASAEMARLPTLHQAFDATLSPMVEDVHYLARDPAIRAYLNEPSMTNRDALSRRLLAFGQAYERYFQLRFIDTRGIEQVRIVRSQQAPGKVTLGASGQDKSNRPYFRIANALSEDQHYLSSWDLNIEQGKLELPLRSTLRLAMPLFDDQNLRRGVLVVNYEGKLLTEAFQRQQMSATGQVMAISADGEWWHHPSGEKRWGRQLGHQDSFSRRYPQVWRAIQDTTQGQIFTADGLFSFSRYVPPGGTLIPQENGNWEATVVSFIPQSMLAAEVDKRFKMSLWLVGVVTPALLILAWYWARHANQARRSRQRADQLSRIVAQSQETVAVTDPEGMITYVNPAFARATGYSEQELVGQSVSLLKSHQHSRHFYRKLWDTIKSGQVFEGVFINRRKDGSRLVEEKMILPIFNDQGDIIEYVGLGRDIGEMQDLQQRAARLNRLAYRDSLTGLPNRLAILARGRQLLARRKAKNTALAFLDLDGFKEVNDRYGHHMGDELLMAFCHRVRGLIRQQDEFGRLAGDEFVLWMEGFDNQQAMDALLQRISEAAAQPYELDGFKVQSGVSIGVVMLEPDSDAPPEDDSVQQLLIQADSAMYQAKRSGKGKVVWWQETPAEPAISLVREA